MKLRGLLADTARRGTVVLSTHNTSEVAALCQRVLVMRAGRILYDGTPRALRATAEGRVWEADVPDASAARSWMTAEGRYRHVGEPPVGAVHRRPDPRGRLPPGVGVGGGTVITTELVQAARPTSHAMAWRPLAAVGLLLVLVATALRVSGQPADTFLAVAAASLAGRRGRRPARPGRHPAGDGAGVGDAPTSTPTDTGVSPGARALVDADHGLGPLARPARSRTTRGPRRVGGGGRGVAAVPAWGPRRRVGAPGVVRPRPARALDRPRGRRVRVVADRARRRRGPSRVLVLVAGRRR